MIRHKLYEEENTLSPIEQRIQTILEGAFCFGDDGENAEITMFWVGSDGIPMIEIRQEDHREFDFPLAEYLGAIELEDDDREEVEDYLEALGLLQESAKPTVRRKLILNEAKSNIGVTVELNSEDSESITNFVAWSRELLQEAGVQLADSKAERVYIKEGNLYYQSPLYIGFRPAQARKLQTRLQKYASKPNFPTGMTMIAERGIFVMPFDIDGEIKLNVTKI